MELDFHNAPPGVQAFQLRRLQSVMNTAARLVFFESSRQLSTSLLHRLQCIGCMRMGITHVQTRRAQPHIPVRPLNRAGLPCSLSPIFLDDNVVYVHRQPLAIPLTRLRTIGYRAFPIAIAIRMWVCTLAQQKMHKTGCDCIHPCLFAES